MPLTFGGATTDDMQIANGSNLSATTCWLVFGWFYPTTFTAGRVLWGASSSTTRLQLIGSDELRLVLNRATSDRAVDTTDANITVDNWWWIAVFIRSSGTAWLAAPGFYVGTPTDPPFLCSSTITTAGSGNSSASNPPTLGNSGASDSNAFQGDIAHFGMAWDATTVETRNIFQQAANSAAAFTAEQLALLYRDWIYPLWSGRYDRFQCSGGMAHEASPTTPRSMSMFHPMDSTLDLRSYADRHGATYGTLGTVGGATTSTARLLAPRPILSPMTAGRVCNSAGRHLGRSR